MNGHVAQEGHGTSRQRSCDGIALRQRTVVTEVATHALLAGGTGKKLRAPERMVRRVVD